MIDGQKVLALIPARGGSRRLPFKNVRLLGGVPLLLHSVQHARDCDIIDAVVVSTEDPVIAAVARDARCLVLDRPSVLAGDDVPTEAVVRHAAASLPEADLIVVLQPTSPLRSAGALLACIMAAASSGRRMWTVGPDGMPSGDVYVVPAELVGEGLTGPGGGSMPIACPLDIDTAEDLAEAERRLALPV